MAGVGLGGFFRDDPNPNPFTDLLPPSGALVGDNGQVVIDEPLVDESAFVNDNDGWDPPTGNGLSAPIFPVKHWEGDRSYTIEKNMGRSKLETLREVEEQIRSLLYERKRLLGELKAERDEIDMRLNVSDKVSASLDEMFPDILAQEIESGVIDER